MPAAKVGLQELFKALKSRYVTLNLDATFAGGIQAYPLKEGQDAVVRPYLVIEPTPGEAPLPGDTFTDMRDFGFTVSVAADTWDAPGVGSGDLLAGLKAWVDYAFLDLAGQNNAKVMLVEPGAVTHQSQGTYWLSSQEWRAIVSQDSVPT
jgi:hypothetical protein